MTVISTLITRKFTVHATDSFLTVAKPDGDCEIIEATKRKLLPVPAWRGGISYWGLARAGTWNTLEWLNEQARLSGSQSSASAFAEHLAEQLGLRMRALKIQNPSHTGLGIHFTCYESVKGYWIPELFLISNWTDSSYSAVRPSGFEVARQTYKSIHKLLDEQPSHADEDSRMEVHAALQEHGMLMFNNGDPLLFSPIAGAIYRTLVELGRRHDALDWPLEMHLAFARRPVEVVSKLLTDFAKTNRRMIGGRPHDLAISPDGQYFSSTGDAKPAV